MAKDPAVLFYTKDFLTGCADLTMEERGQYITLLCLQHQKGALTEKTIRLNVGSVSVDVMDKFQRQPDGTYLNERMADEAEKRANFLESRRLNGTKGGRPKASEKPSAKPNGKAKKNLPVNVNVNVNESINEDANEEKTALVFPFDTPAFMKAWEAWKQYKAEQLNFRYKSVATEQAALTQLSKLTDDAGEAVEIITQSIGNGWKGLFPLKNEQNGRNGKETLSERNARNGYAIVEEVFRQRRAAK